MEVLIDKDSANLLQNLRKQPTLGLAFRQSPPLRKLTSLYIPICLTDTGRDDLIEQYHSLKKRLTPQDAAREKHGKKKKKARKHPGPYGAVAD